MLGRYVIRYAELELDLAQKFRIRSAELRKFMEPINAIEFIYSAYHNASCAILALCSPDIQSALEDPSSKAFRQRRGIVLQRFKDIFTEDNSEYKDLFPKDLLQYYQEAHILREEEMYLCSRDYKRPSNDEVIRIAKMAETYIDRVEDIVRYCSRYKRFPKSFDELRSEQTYPVPLETPENNAWTKYIGRRRSRHNTSGENILRDAISTLPCAPGLDLELESLCEYLDAHLPELQRIYVFGSQARGDWQEYSDVDLIVVLQLPDDNTRLPKRVDDMIWAYTKDLDPFFFMAQHCYTTDPILDMEAAIARGENPLFLTNIQRDAVMIYNRQTAY